MSLWAYLCATEEVVVEQTTTFVRSRRKRIDDDLPLGLRFGRTVSFSSIFKLLLLGDFPDLKLDIPDGVLFVRWIGQIEDNGFTIYRFYLSDNPTDRQPRLILQIVTNPEDEIVDGEVTLWMVREGDPSQFPRTDDDTRLWIDLRDGESGLIGYPVFDDWKLNNLRYLRVDEFADDKRHNVQITLPDGSGEYTDFVCSPKRLSEIVYRDPYGDDTVTLVQDCMIYQRRSSKYDGVPEAGIPRDARVELALLTYNYNDQGGGWVDIRKGIDLQEGDITVI